jgi:uncharacterized delta-60 repeat protein
MKMAAMLLLSLLLPAHGRAQFVLDHFNPDANDAVKVVVVQPDGKILVGGDFSTLRPNGGPAATRNGIARLNPDGTLDTAFNPNANGTVWSIVLQPDGKILVGGNFNTQNGPITIGGQARNFIARLDPTTGLADSFDPNANDDVWSIAVQPDGKILAGGYFGAIGGLTRNRIARLDPTTGLADSFNPNAFGNGIYSIALQADGKILVGGPFLRIGGQTRYYIARLDPTTGLADSFDPEPNNWVQSIAVQPDGKILVCGPFFGEIGGQMRNRIARLDPITGLADSFNPDANGWVYSIALQPDGKILAGGYFTNIGGQTRNHIARLDATTGLADSFDPNANLPYPLNPGTTVYSIAVQADGKILAGGWFDTLAPDGGSTVTRHNIARLEPKPSTLANISTRLRVQTGDNAMIGGFIVTGTQQKKVIVRGIGPSLPLAGALADPIIEVHGASGELLAINDDWNNAATRDEIIASGLAPSHPKESALWGILNPGTYTVIVRGKNDTTGIGLFEVYDLDAHVDSKLANVSTRGFEGSGNDVIIGGVILSGAGPTRVLFRAIGPSLTNFGVANALEDPILELRNGDGVLIAINYDWRDDQEAQIIATGLPPSNNLESAIVRDLGPGNYTTIVHRINDNTGVAVIEAFDLN